MVAPHLMRWNWSNSQTPKALPWVDEFQPVRLWKPLKKFLPIQHGAPLRASELMDDKGDPLTSASVAACISSSCIGAGF